MKKIALIFYFLLISAFSYAQVLKPITWEQTTSVEEAKVGEEIELIFKATLEKDWYLYSSDFDPELGPQVTTIEFTDNGSFEVIGDLQPIDPKKKFDPIWEGDITYFLKKAEFRQKVKVLSENFKIEALAVYQVCTDVTGMCIPLEEEFTFDQLKVSGKVEKTVANTETQTSSPLTLNKAKPLSESLSGLKSSGSLSKNLEPIEVEAPQINEYTTDVEGAEESLWGFILLAFLSGLGALLTPCIYPLIPLTISFFTKKSESRSKGILQALYYGLSIIAIYTLIGGFLAPIGGPEAANFLSTHWLPNLIFFVVFIVFALSFFGMFEIVLPSKLVNSIDKKAEKGGAFGIFFMALTLVVVSFSCTGPLMSTVLIESAGGAFIRPIAGMFGFSLAFAIPFTLFAIFPQWLSKMPKSGGWMNSVKVTFGFIELALAFKFLSNIDLVYHWNFLHRDVMIAIWIAIAAFLGFYYLGKIQLPHDSKLERISVPRMLLALASFTFVVYLIPGMFGAPLNSLSGILPPQTRQVFDIHQPVNGNLTYANNSNRNNEKVKFDDLFDLPHGLSGYFDYEQAMKVAKEEGKPIFIDFTGHGCANCRKMEDNVWSDPQVWSRLQNNYILLALYVDDKTELPESEWETSPEGRTLKTIGKVNMNLEITKFKSNAQPFYILLDHEERLLQNPKPYDLDINNFVSFLDAGLTEFKARNQNFASK